MQNLPISRSLDKKGFDIAKRADADSQCTLPFLPIGLTKPHMSEPISRLVKLARTPNGKERAESIEGDKNRIYTPMQDSGRNTLAVMKRR